MLTQLFLKALRLQAQQAEKKRKQHRLALSLMLPRPRFPTHALHWSAWRRRHQWRGQRCHYRRYMSLYDP